MGTKNQAHSVRCTKNTGKLQAVFYNVVSSYVTLCVVFMQLQAWHRETVQERAAANRARENAWTTIENAGNDENQQKSALQTFDSCQQKCVAVDVRAMEKLNAHLTPNQQVGLLKHARESVTHSAHPFDSLAVAILPEATD